MLSRTTLVPIGMLSLVLGLGCAKAPMASPERDAAAKLFAPVANKAVVYVYRDEKYGAAVKIPIVINHRVVGDTVAKSYFKIILEPGECEVQCKAESDSRQAYSVAAGKIYFFRQEMKMGLWSAGCMMHLVAEDEGRRAVSQCNLLESAETLAK